MQTKAKAKAKDRPFPQWPAPSYFNTSPDLSDFNKDGYLENPNGSMVVCSTIAGKKVILRNGDYDYDTGLNNVDGTITFSLQCFAALFESVSNNKVLKTIHKEVKIVHYTKDETRKVKNTDVNARGEYKKQMPLGFSLLSNIEESKIHFKLHRAGSILFKYKGDYYIAGMDEGSYFCSQLPKTRNNPKTINDAFKILTPPECRKSGVLRQGEWFAIPVKKNEVPQFKDCLASGTESMILPVETNDSNYHIVQSRVQSCDIRVGPDGVIYCYNCDIYHDEHAELNLHGWCKFVKNTAVRSFSVGGVD